MKTDLITKVRSGDVDAFTEIVREYQGTLLGYASQRLPDHDAVLDVVQLTFIRAFETIEDYDPEREMGIWLCVICRHFILTELDRRRRESKNLRNLQDAVALRLSEAMAAVEEPGRTMAADCLQRLDDCVSKLPQKFAEIIDRKYKRLQSCRQIADAQARSVTWVTSNLSRARQLLKECLERHDHLAEGSADA